MAVGFLLMFCVFFLVIDESCGIVQACSPRGDTRPVSAVINFRA